jgi:hypothetical protein
LAFIDDWLTSANQSVLFAKYRVLIGPNKPIKRRADIYTMVKSRSRKSKRPDDGDEPKAKRPKPYNELPVDVIWGVLEFLEPQEVINIACMSKAYHDLVCQRAITLIPKVVNDPWTIMKTLHPREAYRLCLNEPDMSLMEAAKDRYYREHPWAEYLPALEFMNDETVWEQHTNKYASIVSSKFGIIKEIGIHKKYGGRSCDMTKLILQLLTIASPNNETIQYNVQGITTEPKLTGPVQVKTVHAKLGTHIKKIDLSGLGYISMRTLLEILAETPFLDELNICNTGGMYIPYITMAEMPILEKMRSLTFISTLSTYPHMYYEDMLQLMPNLEYVHFIHERAIMNNEFLERLATFKKLKSIIIIDTGGDMQGHIGITDNAVATLINSLPDLETFKLLPCGDVTGTVFELLNSRPKLKSISLQRINGIEFYPEAREYGFINVFPEMRSIELIGFRYARFWDRVDKACPKIQHIRWDVGTPNRKYIYNQWDIVCGWGWFLVKEYFPNLKCLDLGLPPALCASLLGLRAGLRIMYGNTDDDKHISHHNK